MLAVAHDGDELFDMLGRRLRHDAMAEIENERTLRERGDDLPRRCRHRLAARDHEERIEIALNGPDLLKLIPCDAERHCGVEADRRDLGFREIVRIEQPGAARKTDDWQRRVLLAQRIDDTPRRLNDPTLEPWFGQYAGP